ncbi:MAG: hypothetical protein Q6363_010005 [Candidatus Njordarchaeota archaeon]
MEPKKYRFLVDDCVGRHVRKQIASEPRLGKDSLHEESNCPFDHYAFGYLICICLSLDGNF